MTDPQSLYCYPGTKVLINKFGIRNPLALHQTERLVTGRQSDILGLRPITGRFDLQHLCKIHEFLFRDIYPFAGQLRREDIGKKGTWFTPHEQLAIAGDLILRGLHKERSLRGLSADAFSERAAHYHTEINARHFFREGNGRTQREFIRTLALNAGYQLDWSRVDPTILLEASVRAMRDPQDLARAFRQTLVNREPSREIQRTYDRFAQTLQR